MGVVRELLTTAYAGSIPPLLAALLPDDARLDAEALAFVAGPIVPMRGAAGVRGYVANPGQPDFATRVAEVVGGDGFLLGPGRRMVDVGPGTVTLFRDDLHLEDGGRVVAETLALPGGERGWLARPDAGERVDADLAAARAEAEALGLDGLWLLASTGPRITHWLVVNEDRWRGSPEGAAARLDALGDPRWCALRAVARAHGLAAYPDAVEVSPDGWHVTVGLFDPTSPGRRR